MMNRYAVFRDHPASLYREIPQVTRAASLAHGFLVYKQLLEKDAIPPDTARKKPLCMDQSTRIFSTTRLPGPSADRIQTFPFHQSRHLLVMRKDQLYTFDAFDQQGNLISEAHLQAQFQFILEDSECLADEPPIGVMTAERRDTWAKVSLAPLSPRQTASTLLS